MSRKCTIIPIACTYQVYSKGLTHSSSPKPCRSAKQERLPCRATAYPRCNPAGAPGRLRGQPGTALAARAESLGEPDATAIGYAVAVGSCAVVMAFLFFALGAGLTRLYEIEEHLRTKAG